jgi:uncharacterized repeat protein (TIGR01451 family)
MRAYFSGRIGVSSNKKLLLIFLFSLILLPGTAFGLATAGQNDSVTSLIVPSFFEGNYSTSHEPLASLEDLLRGEAQLLSSFDILLNKTNRTTNETVSFLNSFEDLLRRQTVLYDGFESVLKSQWYRLDCDEQKKFLASLEDLLHRETILYANFNDLNQESWGDLPQEEQVKLLASFEDLLRRQTNLQKGYEDLLKMNYGGLTLEKSADKSVILCGDTVTYRYTVKNWYKEPIKNLTIIDDQLGEIVDKIELRAGEEKTFTKSVVLTGSTCNRAKACAEGPCGDFICDESNTVCVKLIINKGVNEDNLIVGSQYTLSAGSDPTASNTIVVKKNQMLSGGKRFNQSNNDNIQIGDQRANGVTGHSNNVIKIVANQE